MCAQGYENGFAGWKKETAGHEFTNYLICGVSSSEYLSLRKCSMRSSQLEQMSYLALSVYLKSCPIIQPIRANVVSNLTVYLKCPIFQPIRANVLSIVISLPEQCSVI